MKLLIDANISWRSAKKIQNIFPDSIHVNRSGLAAPPPDAAIWNYAKQHGFHILTQDEDYMDMALISGFPPKVILLQNRKHGYRKY